MSYLKSAAVRKLRFSPLQIKEAKITDLGFNNKNTQAQRRYTTVKAITPP
jgi:hypothetical protein